MAIDPQKNSLIIFVKHPVEGKVKTRLATTLGPATATQVYKQLLQLTHSATRPLHVSKNVYYTDEIIDQDLWSQGGYHKHYQHGQTLGQRMEAAFADQFARGYERVIIIGSDNPQLSTSDIEHAFAQLEKHEVVIGPAHDGGYYLLGLRKPLPYLFSNMPWSSQELLQETLAVLKSHDVDSTLLDWQSDIDTEEDYQKLKHLLPALDINA